MDDYPNELSIEQLIKSHKEVMTCQKDDLLGTVLARTQSSHDGVFVYEGNKFLGLLPIYRAISQARHSYTTRVDKLILSPDHLTKQSTISEATRAMLSTKTYILPVFEKNTVIGIIHCDDLLFYIANNNKMLLQILKHIRISSPITNSQGSTVKDIMITMKKNSISRVIIVDDEGDLVGIVSRRDLADAFNAGTVRQRYRRRESATKYASYFDEEKISRQDGPITMFYSRAVLTAGVNDSVKGFLRKMLRAKKNSLVIVDGQKPVGFVSKHDFLKASINLEGKKEIPVRWEDKKRFIAEFTKITFFSLIDTFIEQLKKRSHPMWVELHVDGKRNRVGKTNWYEIKIHTKLKEGDLIISKSQNRIAKAALQDAIDKTERQLYK